MKLRYRIGLTVIALIVIPIVIVILLQTNRTREMTVSHRVEGIQSIARLLASSFPADYGEVIDTPAWASGGRLEKIAMLNSRLQPLVENTVRTGPAAGVIYYLYELDSIVAAEPYRNLIGEALPSDHPIQGAVHSGDLDIQKSPGHPYGVRGVVEPLVYRGRVVGALLVSYDGEAIMAEVRRAVLLDILWLVTAVVASFSTAWLLSKMLGDDLGRLRRAAKGTADALEFNFPEMAEVAGEASIAARERNFMFRLVDNLRFGLAAVDRDLKFTFVSDGFVSLTGFSRKEILGRSYHDVAARMRLPDGKSTDRQDSLMTLIRKTLQEGTSDRFRRRIIRKDGALVPVEIDLHPLYEEGGGVSGIMALVTSLAAEDDAKKLRDISNFILDSVQGGVMMIDSAERVVVFNRGASVISGIPASDVLGRDARDAFPDMGDADRLAQMTLREGIEFSNVRQSLLMGGSQRELLTSTCLVRDMDNNVVGAAVTFHDVTDLVAAETRAQRAERLAVVGEMAAGAAHEIRNPLTSVKGFLQLFRNRFQELGLREDEELCDLILKELDRIADIVTEILLLARVRPLNRTTVEVNSLARQIRDLALATPSGLEVVTELDGGLPPVSVDREQILQVCWNMVNNAIEAMDGQGTLTIGTRLVKEQKAVAIDLSDTGPGIKREDLPRIFDPFYSTKPNGTGLGLSICHRIVEEHRGSIEVRTELGKGSTFSVILPVGEH